MVNNEKNYKKKSNENNSLLRTKEGYKISSQKRNFFSCPKMVFNRNLIKAARHE